MGGARHPKPYNDEPRIQVTIPWKRRVLARLAENKASGKRPATIEQLRLEVEAAKGSLNTLFDLERDPQQLTSTYAEAISKALEVAPPLIEEDGDDDDLIRIVRQLRSLTPESRRALMLAASHMAKKP